MVLFDERLTSVDAQEQLDGGLGMGGGRAGLDAVAAAALLAAYLSAGGEGAVAVRGRPPPEPPRFATE